jgi:DNA-directed RNA polymerase specialized sigma24 family protein
MSMATPVAGRHYHHEPLTDAQRDLASDPAVLRMAQRIAERASRHRPNLLADELQSAAMLAVVQAARTFDPAHDACWKTHATHRIRGSIKDALRSWFGGRKRGLMYAHSLDAPVEHNGEPIGPHSSLFMDNSPPVGWALDREDACLAVARAAGGWHKYVVRMLTRADCLTHRGTGTATGMTESRVSQEIQRAVQRLRTQHEDGAIDLMQLVQEGG